MTPALASIFQQNVQDENFAFVSCINTYVVIYVCVVENNVVGS